MPASKAEQQALFARLWDCGHIQAVHPPSEYAEIVVTFKSPHALASPMVVATIRGGQASVQVFRDAAPVRSFTPKDSRLRDLVERIVPTNTARAYFASAHHMAHTTIQWKRAGCEAVELTFDSFGPECLARIEQLVASYERED